jgi:hypothetical protein
MSSKEVKKEITVRGIFTERKNSGVHVSLERRVIVYRMGEE